jgi:hypothetical protein
MTQGIHSAAPGETWLFWDTSTDDTTAQSVIEYRVLLNGVYDHSVVGFNRTILYGNPNSWNMYTVIAVDASGSESAQRRSTSLTSRRFASRT